MFGGFLLSLMPTASSSFSSSALCSAFFVASSTIMMRSLVFAAEMTCRPLPFPSAAPSIMPGKSRTWISAPPYSITPGIAVSVVNAYAATAALVFVIFERSVDFPTEGNPTRAIRASISHTLPTPPNQSPSHPIPIPIPIPIPRRTSGFGHIESCPRTARLLAWTRLQQLGAQACELAFQQTEMVLGRFVFPTWCWCERASHSARRKEEGDELRPLHLIFDFFDSFGDTHFCCLLRL